MCRSLDPSSGRVQRESTCRWSSCCGRCRLTTRSWSTGLGWRIRSSRASRPGSPASARGQPGGARLHDQGRLSPPEGVGAPGWRSTSHAALQAAEGPQTEVRWRRTRPSPESLDPRCLRSPGAHGPLPRGGPALGLRRGRVPDDRHEGQVEGRHLPLRAGLQHVHRRAHKSGSVLTAERQSAPRLERLTNQGWRVLYSIPVGSRGSDIDRLLTARARPLDRDNAPPAGTIRWAVRHRLVASPA